MWRFGEEADNSSLVMSVSYKPLPFLTSHTGQKWFPDAVFLYLPHFVQNRSWFFGTYICLKHETVTRYICLCYIDSLQNCLKKLELLVNKYVPFHSKIQNYVFSLKVSALNKRRQIRESIKLTNLLSLQCLIYWVLLVS